MVHEKLHRRHVRRQNPFKEAASAIAEAFGGHDQHDHQSTVVSIIYVTATPTFTGAIGGYTTQGPVIETTSTPDADVNSSPPDEGVTNTGIQVEGKTSTSSTMPTAILPSKTSVAPSLVVDTSTSSKVAVQTSHTSVSAANATSSNTPTSSSSGGMSTAGKAGLAIGILLLLGAVLSIVLFCFKKRREKREREDDEKHEFGDMNRQASQRTAAPNAPRLSLRPVTQFLPNLGEKRQSRGNALNMGRPIAQNAERPITPQSNRENPFGNHAETIDPTNAKGPEVVQGMGPGGEVLTGATAAAAVAGLTRGASKRGFGPIPIDLTKKAPFAGPPSPAHTEFSVSSEAGSPSQGASASGAAIAAAGGPANSAVHRVQLDFKPSMDDELELRAGQLIRVLHEYDDGWALCIRLDRSQQGVVPRTCLSTRPVKPRPQQNGPRGPPPPGMRVPQQQPRPMSPAGRPMTPNGQQPRPMSPSQRPMTPNGQHPRPMSPSMQRPMTPNGQHPRPMSPSQQRPMQGRPGSPSQMQARRNSPPGPSAMNPQYSPSSSPPGPQFASGSPPNGSPIGRKPVPGQAM